jgi:integrase
MKEEAMKKKQEEKQELTEAEKSKWLCWSCIVQTRDKIGEDYKKDGKWRTFQDYLIVCLYTMMPPERLDYTPMKFVAEMPTDTEHNYCVLTDMKATFILNNYKTYKSKGQALYDAPYELMPVLHAWRKINKSEWLLVKKTNKTEPLPSHELGQVIPRIFERENKIPATLNILRHSFITDMREGEMPLLEKKRLANRMGHSLAQAEKYLRLNTQ